MLFTTLCIDDPEHQGLVQDLDKLSRLVSSAHNPPVDKIDKIFQHLDVSQIPNTADKPTEKDERAVDLALVSMLVILACERHLKMNCVLDASLSAGWPSVWKWLEYLDTECCQKGVFSAALHIRGLVGIAYTLSAYGASEALRRLATSTPGVINMLARYWLAEDQQSGIEPLLNAAGVDRHYTHALEVMLQAEDTSLHCLLPEVIAAAPGGAKSVARTGILRLNNDASKKDPNFRSICQDLSLINNLCCKSCPALQLALLNHGIIPTLVKMLSLFNAQTMDNTHVIYCVKICYSILIKAFQCANGTSWIVQAFDSGLLQVLLKSGRRLAKLNESNRNLCITLLSDILCQYLVYRSVLCSVGKVLRRVERLDIDQDVAGPLWDGWLLFKGLAQERINFAIQVENDDVRQNDCNRMGCDQTDEADSLLRCSSCLSMLYCGRNCQRLDWPSHKSSCQQLKRALQEGTFTPVSESDTLFIARLVTKDVFTHPEKLPSYIKEHGEPTMSISLLAMNLNYTTVPVTVTVLPASELLGIDDYWDSLIQKTQESEGNYIFTRAEVRRGDLVPSVANAIPAPVRRRL